MYTHTIYTPTIYTHACVYIIYIYIYMYTYTTYTYTCIAFLGRGRQPPATVPSLACARLAAHRTGAST